MSYVALSDLADLSGSHTKRLLEFANAQAQAIQQAIQKGDTTGAARVAASTPWSPNVSDQQVQTMLQDPKQAQAIQDKINSVLKGPMPASGAAAAPSSRVMVSGGAVQIVPPGGGASTTSARMAPYGAGSYPGVAAGAAPASTIFGLPTSTAAVIGLGGLGLAAIFFLTRKPHKKKHRASPAPFFPGYGYGAPMPYPVPVAAPAPAPAK